MRPSRICAFVITAALSLAMVCPGFAGTLEVKPIRVELAKGQHAATFTVTNEGAEPVRVQVTAFAWDMSQSGQMKLTNTDDLFLFPPLLVIPPQGSRSVRVGFDVPPADRELSFRVYFEELPSLLSQLQPSAGAAVMLREKIGVPIFMEPENAHARATVQDVSVNARGVHFAVADEGTQHVNVSDLTVTGLSGNGKALFRVPVQSWYILAGEKQTFNVPLSESSCKGLEKIAVSGKVDAGGEINATVPASCLH